MGSVLRITGTWIVTTALVVLGVDAAIDSVARDVSVSRPAPMTPGEVDEQLREHHGATSTTAVRPAGEVSPPTGSTSVPPTDVATPTARSTETRSPSDEPPRTDAARPSTPAGRPDDVGVTTTVRGSPTGKPDERGSRTRP